MLDCDLAETDDRDGPSGFKLISGNTRSEDGRVLHDGTSMGEDR